MTRMLVGAQPPVSWYRTENWNDVEVVPVPGETVPADSDGWCEAPLQLAAMTADGVPTANARDPLATMMASRAMICRPTLDRADTRALHVRDMRRRRR
jgi:hypothetical protein